MPWVDLQPKQLRVEAALSEWLYRCTAEAPPVLAEAMRYSLLAPGKRLRPILCLLACEAAGGTAEAALPAACAVEMIHTYSLIHDDLPAMDDDDLRRGLPTSHKKFGEALAILAGDALLSAAFEILAAGDSAPLSAVSILELSRASGAVGMVGGQVLDLVADGRIHSDHRAELQAIHRAKTGALFRAAMRLGVLAATNGDVRHPAYSAMTMYAESFGLAFQVTDDLLDVQSSSESTGKRVGKDAKRGKLTYPGLLGIEASRAKAEGLVSAATRAVEPWGRAGILLAKLAEFLLTRNR